MQAVTGDHVEVAFVDQGYTGDTPADDAAVHGIRLEVIKHTEAKRGFVLLPRRPLRHESAGAMMEEDRVALCGVRYAHELQQPASRAGTVASEVSCSVGARWPCAGRVCARRATRWRCPRSR